MDLGIGLSAVAVVVSVVSALYAKRYRAERRSVAVTGTLFEIPCEPVRARYSAEYEGL